MNWLQKAREYDYIKNMNDYWKQSRDMWQSLCIEKARELSLMTKVADNWQAKLIAEYKKNDAFINDTNIRLNGTEQACQLMNDIMDEEEKTIGRRLKFSVGHNHVTITIGNPITLCNNYKSESNEADNSISMCSRKDSYDWKIGAIQSLDNLCESFKYTQTLRRELRQAMGKKYPEVFDVHS